MKIFKHYIMSACRFSCNGISTVCAALSFFLALGMSPVGAAASDSDIEDKPDCDVAVAQDGSGDYGTVQEAIDAVLSDTVLCIKPGTYNLSGFSKTIHFRLSLIGEDRDSTILTNGSTLKPVKGLTVKNLTFSDYKRTIFSLTPYLNQVQEGITIENNVFKNSAGILRDDRSQSGSRIRNVRIVNNTFIDLVSHGGVKAIGIAGEAALENIVVRGNTFRNLRSTNNKKYAIAIMVGDNVTRQVNKDIDISCNLMDGIVGGTAAPPTGNDHPPTHGVLAYGDNINVANNIIRNLNQNRDHEAIYLKADNSRIVNNVVENGGAYGGGGDITIKGRANDNNLIAGNRVTGSHLGNAIYSNGEVVIERNYIQKPNGGTAIRSYGYGKRVDIRNNDIQSKESSILVADAAEGEIRDNVMNGTISIESSRVVEENNMRVGTGESPRTEAAETCVGVCPSGYESGRDSGCPENEGCCEAPGLSVDAVEG